jgi:16S rRNA (cytosine967-C5)-methyltransferase
MNRVAPRTEAPGLAARRVASDLLLGVLRRNQPLDDQLEQRGSGFSMLGDRDRALARNIAATALRRLGTLRRMIGARLERGLPAEAPRVETALLVGATQILFLDVPNHAAVDLSVRIVQADRHAARYAGLVNAVLRRLAQEGPATAVADDPSSDTPHWLLARWRATYGDATAAAIAEAHRHEAALDLTLQDGTLESGQAWAARLRGRLTPTGTVRLVAQGVVSLLPGFAEGAWWVQDAAAALPARLFGDVRGRRIADVCAAPGGKTAQLAAAGALVTAVDRSPRRVLRLNENLARLRLAAETVVADANEWQSEPFDGVLLDAPCSSTGTIRRHPDIAWLKKEGDLAGLVDLQRRLLDRSVDLLRPGATLVYCTCSLEPEEGEQQIESLLARDARVRRQPIGRDEVGGTSEFVTTAGDLRTLPCHWPDPEPRMAGLDGFYAARLVRT